MNKVIVEHNGRTIELYRPNIEDLLKGGKGMNKVRMYRSGAKITLEDMAEALGISKPTYISRENGESDWKLEEMKKFVNVINVATNSHYTINDIFLD